MGNRILDLRIEQVRLDYVEAELLILVRAESPGADVRGRLHGPRCPGLSTLEDSFPLGTLPSTSPDELVCRVVITEPMFWTEETPFVYVGDIELWDHGGQADSRPVSVRFRSPKGVT